MIDPVTAVGGMAGAGAIIGTISNIILHLIDSSSKKKQIEAQERMGLTGKLQEYQQNFKTTSENPYEINVLRVFSYKGFKAPKAITPPFYSLLLILTTTYCICTAVCFLAGDIPVSSQGFNVEPSTLSVLFGLYQRSTADPTVYVFTFAGLGTYFMSPIAFILTAVLTGIVPRKGF